MRLFLLALLATPWGAFAAPLQPLSEAAQAAFAAITPDPAPKSITRNSHYWVSNEYQHDLFLDALKDKGGVHIGVGSDQNYLIAGWSKPEALVLLDFDAQVPRLHRIYKHAFAHAETPDAFYALWAEKNIKQLAEWVKAELPKGRERKRTLDALRFSNKAVRRRLRLTRRAYGKREIPTFLTDQAQYDYVRNLWATGRVFPVRGDLTGELALRSVGAAAKKAGLPVRSLYLSNAEQYFDYTPAFRANIAALPFDERSVVLHTIAWSGFGFADGHYHYAWQPGLNFQLWMATSRVKNLPRMLRYRDQSKRTGFSTITKSPDAAGKLIRKGRSIPPKRRPSHQ